MIEFFTERGSGGNPGHGINGSTLGSTHSRGKNPGDIVEANSLDELKASKKELHMGSIVRYKGELYEVVRPNSLHQPKSDGRDARLSIQAHYDDLPVMRTLLGKNPGDTISLAPETRRLSAIIGDDGAVKVPGGQGWVGHPPGGGARIYREQDQRWLPEDGKNPGDFWSVNTQPYLEAHFATFPLGICYDPILASSPPDGIVMDIFAGSGTVAEAVEIINRAGKKPTLEQVKQIRAVKSTPLKLEANRKWIMLEVKTKYCWLIEKRLEPYGT